MNKVVRIILIVVVIVAIAIFGFYHFTKSHSPSEKVKIENQGLKVSVDYCRPYKKGRKIFGGILPYGKVWRTGANEATVIDFNEDVVIGGKALGKGEYSLWTIPTETEWTIIFNKETGQWGTSYDGSKDVLKVQVPSQKSKTQSEQFLINLSPQTDGVDMILNWDETEVVVPIKRK